MRATEFWPWLSAETVSLAQLGLTLAEGCSLVARVQAELVSKQVEWWLSGQTHCRRCGAGLSHNDSRSTVLRTVYGKVTVKSPRLWSCACQRTARTPRRVVYPMSKALTRRVTPELEYLQAKWAAHLPYRQATAMLKEVLPLDKGISFSGTRDRIRSEPRCAVHRRTPQVGRRCHTVQDFNLLLTDLQRQVPVPLSVSRHAIRSPLGGIEVMHMIAKGQTKCTRGTPPSAADQFYKLET
jgi:hypothetical protein